jgi:hypothetical protein
VLFFNAFLTFELLTLEYFGGNEQELNNFKGREAVFPDQTLTPRLLVLHCIENDAIV